MWRKIVLTIVALIAIASSEAQTSSRYSLYQNYRFGYYLRYPTYLQLASESSNGDGIRMQSNDGSIVLSVSGILNVLSDNAHTLMSDMVTMLCNRGCSVTYSYINDNSVVLSGYTKSGKIYYLKSVLSTVYSPSCEEYMEYIATAYVEHSKKDKAKGDDIIRQFKYFPYKP